MNPTRTGHPFPKFLLLAIAITSLGLVACSDQSPTAVVEGPGVSAVSKADTPYGEAAGADEGIGVESFYSESPSADASEALLFHEYRLCDGTKSTYTVEGNTGSGKGEGGTVSHAQVRAIADAVKNNIGAQFTCSTCPDGDECDKIFSSVWNGGATMDDPAQDCTYDRTKKKFVCDGAVTFNTVAGANPPHARAGCAECD